MREAVQFGLDRLRVTGSQEMGRELDFQVMAGLALEQVGFGLVVAADEQNDTTAASLTKSTCTVS
jgi:predicted porin